MGALQKTIWKLWYPFVTRRLQGEDVLFLNYAFETDPPLGIPLSAADEPNRTCIQLYHHVASQAEWRGKQVLEVSCGHGGGASYLARTFEPARYTALDLNPAGIAFCNKRHQVAGLGFLQGDAENLPFTDAEYDLVMNVEASHCYPDFARFLDEVARVLRPGGHFLYADFRFHYDIAKWEAQLAACPLRLVKSEVIDQAVLRGMELNSARYLALLNKTLPRPLRGIGREFAGLEGSLVHRALLNGGMSYRSYCFVKE